MKFRPQSIFTLLAILVMHCVFSLSFAQEKPIPQLVKTGEKYTLMVDGKPFIMMGGQVLNNSAFPSRMERVWPIMKAMDANMIQFPVYWDEIEPQQGRFEFGAFDQILRSARTAGLRVVPLWFGTWKNGMMDYTPAWIKADPVRFPRVLNPYGQPVDSLSPNSKTNMEADRQAFSALMKHIREVDEADRTVIMVQVENEPGVFGSVRDFSAETTKQFNSPVPTSLVTALNKTPGTWQEVFGKRAGEFFNAYSIATYINEVAKAGKAVYPLPMYINVWNGGDGVGENEDKFDYPGEGYPSGGATTTVHDLYKAIAKSIDVLAIDCYWQSPRKFRDAVQKFKRPDNPTFLPETGRGIAPGAFFWVIGEFDGIGFSPFGIDGDGSAGTDWVNSVGLDYRICRPAMDIIANLQGTGKLQVAVEEPGIRGMNLHFDQYDMAVRFSVQRRFAAPVVQPTMPEPAGPGRVMVAQLAPDEFLFMGASVSIDIRPAFGSGYLVAQYLRAEEGTYEGGAWKAERVINGDISGSGLTLPANGAMIRVKLTR
jgi:hypothetical protein